MTTYFVFDTFNNYVGFFDTPYEAKKWVRTTVEHHNIKDNNRKDFSWEVRYGKLKEIINDNGDKIKYD